MCGRLMQAVSGSGSALLCLNPNVGFVYATQFISGGKDNKCSGEDKLKLNFPTLYFSWFSITSVGYASGRGAASWASVFQIPSSAPMGMMGQDQVVEGGNLRSGCWCWCGLHLEIFMRSFWVEIYLIYRRSLWVYTLQDSVSWKATFWFVAWVEICSLHELDRGVEN